MKKLNFILVLFLVLLVSGIGIVSAETLTGTIGGSNFTQTTITQVSGTSTTAQIIPGLYVNTFQNTGNLKSIVMWSKSVGGSTAFLTDTGAPAGASTPVTIRISNQTLNSTTHRNVKTDGRIVGTGTFGYQKVFSTATPPVESIYAGYLWLAIDTWDLGTETGTQFLSFDYNPADIYNVSYGSYAGSSVGIPAGFATFTVSQGTTTLAGDAAGGTQSNLKDNAISAIYTVSKPAGVGIMGSIEKSVGGQNFTSQALVYDATGAIITSESTLTQNRFNFSVTSAQVILGIKDSVGNKYNTSLLFDPVGVTPTPTPTPVPGTTIPAGYIRTTLNIWDRSGAMIHGANIQLKDIEAGVWSNSTSDADGIHFIDTLPGHTVNMYSDYTVFSNEFLPGSLLAQEAGYNYFITLFPYESGASAGNVSLYVEVKDTMGSFIPYANVQITLPTGYSYSGSTANAGSKVFIVPNNTQIRATGTASGYLPATIIANSGSSSGGSTTITIELTRQIVTTAPTSTVPPGGVTPAVTFDSRSINQKDADMMGQIRDAGPDLISLAIAVTMISLLGLMMKGFK